MVIDEKPSNSNKSSKKKTNILWIRLRMIKVSGIDQGFERYN